MRDFLEEALNHRDDGYGRAQKHTQRDLPKRFYETVDTAPVEGGFAVLLDKRPLKTPTMRPIVVPNARLTALIAAEWASQTTHIDPLTMPHTRLVNAAVEGGEAARPALVDQVVAFCANDLLLYRADSPRELVALQERVWDDALVRLARRFSVRFEPAIGIVHKPQPPQTLAALEAFLADADLFTAAALASITGLTGSGLLAVALRADLLDPEAVWTAAHVDEDYQIAQWGEDFDASERRQRRRMEYDAAVNFIRYLS